jgi:dUTP pyrophosphatase
MIVKIKKLHPDAVIPFYAKSGDAGMDLVAVTKEETNRYIQYKTGLAFEIPTGYAGFIFPRSSNSNIDLIMSNCVAVIDSGYRGEVMIRFKPTRHYSYMPHKTYEIGDKVAQIIIMPYPEIQFEEVDDLSKTERGDGGFGHTGN